MATSLDGFVAREDHKLDWPMKQDTQGEDHGYDAFIESVDGIIMGSGSFRTVIGFEECPYTIPVVVMSQTLTIRDVPARLQGKVKLSALEPQDLLEQLESEGQDVDLELVSSKSFASGLVQSHYRVKRS